MLAFAACGMWHAVILAACSPEPKATGWRQLKLPHSVTSESCSVFFLGASFLHMRGVTIIDLPLPSGSWFKVHGPCCSWSLMSTLWVANEGQNSRRVIIVNLVGACGHLGIHPSSFVRHVWVWQAKGCMTCLSGALRFSGCLNRNQMFHTSSASRLRNVWRFCSRLHIVRN